VQAQEDGDHVTLPVGPLTPYVTPELLTSAPTGISWSTIPPGRGTTPAQQLAEQANICARATAQADTYCNQVLRATLDTEIQQGPDFRITIQNGTGNGRFILQRWPVLQIVSLAVSPNTFPRSYVTVPATAYDIEHPVIGVYGSNAPSAAGEGGQSIVFSGAYINWALGRNGYVVKCQYVNGWPHTSLTQPTSAGAMVLNVDDCTGWAITSEALGVTGATGTVFDSGNQEVVHVTGASATAGPGTLTLAAPLQYGHGSGVMVSTLPQSAIWAVILFGSSMALTRGATSTTVQSIPGGGSGGSGVKSPADLAGEAELLLNPFRRTV
jgi:hypothetical protein